MSDTSKLKEAVKLSIEAGYQLNKDAFEFLDIISTTEDPTGLVNKAINKMETLKEKPVFIGRELLEALIETTKPKQGAADIDVFEEPVRSQLKPQLTKGKGQFRPFAKDVEADVEVIQDPTTQLNSTGTIEDYLQYFRDRFKRMEKLLRKRIDARNASSIIDALKASANTKLKIIAMVTRKRESRKWISLTVEDLQSRTTVLVSRNARTNLLEKATTLLHDQVVCIGVVKSRGSLLIAEDIILPDIAERPQHKAPIPIHAALTSDMHIGSTKFQRNVFNHFILWLNGKYGNGKMREIAGNVKYVLIAGDIVDGIGIYPNQIEELAVKEVYEQYRLAGKFLEQIPDYVEVVIIPGNHDAVRKALPQPAIPNEFLEPLQESRKVHSLGNPSYLRINNVELLMHHGRSLEDIMSTAPGIDHNSPEKAMTLLLRSRHLAPVYGGKTPLSPENRDFLVIEHTPDIFHSGHIHKLGYNNYRGILVVNSGCWQEQTDYMCRHGFVPTPGMVPVVNLHTMKTTTVPFT